MAGKRINMIMQPDVLLAVDDAARLFGISRSRFINMALTAYLAGNSNVAGEKRTREAEQKELHNRVKRAVEELARFLVSIDEPGRPEDYPMH